MTPAARLLLVALGATVACARPPSPLPAAPPTAIDLAPRCLALPDAPAISGEPTAREAAAAIGARLAGDARVLTLATPHAALETAALGVPFERPASPFDEAFAAAVLAEGALSPEPAAHRRRRDALGGPHAVHVGEGWLWLEIAFHPDERAAALEWLGDARRVVETDPADPAVMAALERRARITTLADAAAPERLAERAFDRLAGRDRAGAPAPPAPREPAAWRAWLASALASPHARILHAAAVADAAAPEAEAFRLAARRRLETGDDPNGTPLPAAVTAETVDAASTTITPSVIHVVDRAGAPQVELRVGLPTVASDAPDAPALEALASLLGRDVGGRLFRDLRERQGLVYRIDAFRTPAGDFVVSTRARPERVAALLVGIEAHWRALVERGLLDCEVEMLRARLAGETALEGDDPGERLATLRRALEGADPVSAALADLRRPIAALDRATLEAVARRHLDRPPLVVLVGDADALAPSLEAAFPDRPLHVFDAALERVR